MLVLPKIVDANHLANAEPMSIVAMVTIKLGIFSRVTENALIAPKITPTSSTQMMATTVASSGYAASGESTMTYPPITLPTARIDVHERSVPALS